MQLMTSVIDQVSHQVSLGLDALEELSECSDHSVECSHLKIKTEINNKVTMATTPVALHTVPFDVGIKDVKLWVASTEMLMGFTSTDWDLNAKVAQAMNGVFGTFIYPAIVAGVLPVVGLVSSIRYKVTSVF